MENLETISTERIIAALKKDKLLILLFVVLFSICGIIFVSTSTPLYSAKTRILLDEKQGDFAADVSSSTDSRSFTIGSLESQIEIIKSQKIALQVIDTLDLTKNEILSNLTDQDPQLEKQKFVAYLSKNVKANIVGQSYVLEIFFTSKNPLLSRDIANAYAEAYISDQIRALSSSSDNALDWITLKIEETKKKSTAAEQAVQNFRLEKGLVSIGSQSILEQQISELNTQLGVSRSELSANKAQYDYSQKIIENRDINGAIEEAANNDVINSIRTRYLQDSKRLQNLRKRLGSTHQAVKDLVVDVQDHRNLIFQEMQRISEGYQTQYQIALDKVEFLEKALEDLLKVKAQNDVDMIELEGLQQEAQAYRASYDNYLEKYEEVVQKKSFPLVDLRIIASATAPVSPSFPNSRILLPLFGLLGLFAGMGYIVIRELANRSLRNRNDIREQLNMKFAGYIPRIKQKSLKSTKKTKILPNSFVFSSDIFLQSVHRETSLFGNTSRTILGLIEQKKPSQQQIVVGIVSASPSEGKSTVAANLANFMASQGHKTLLVDMDLKKPSLSRDNFHNASAGVFDVAKGHTDLASVTLSTNQHMLDFVPAFGKDVRKVGKLVSIQEENRLLSTIDASYKFVFLDLGPLSVAQDLGASAKHVDGYVVVSKWNITRASHVLDGLAQNEIPVEKVFGVVLNLCNSGSIEQYYGSAAYLDQ